MGILRAAPRIARQLGTVLTGVTVYGLTAALAYQGTPRVLAVFRLLLVHDTSTRRDVLHRSLVGASHTGSTTEAEVNFSKAFDFIMGRYVREDSSVVETYGLSEEQYREIDFRSASLEDIRNIYRRDYWDAVHADELPSILRLEVFRISTLYGVSATISMLQSALGLEETGELDRQTQVAVKTSSPEKVLLLFVAAQLEFLSCYGRGYRMTLNIGETANSLRHVMQVDLRSSSLHV